MTPGHRGSVACLLCLAGGGMAAQAKQPDGVTIFGAADASVKRTSRSGWTLNADTNSFLGLKAREKLGTDLSVGMTAEVKQVTQFDDDGSRRSVTLADALLTLDGRWGTLKLGRTFTAAQDALYLFEPFDFRTEGSVLAITGNYVTDPRHGGATGYQFERGFHYNTPEVTGWQAGISLAKRRSPAGAGPMVSTDRPCSLALLHSGERSNTMFGWETGLNGDRLFNVSGALSWRATRWMATWSRYLPAGGSAERNLALGLVVQADAGSTARFGYGRIAAPGAPDEHQLSAGYWHRLARPVTIYTDLSGFWRGRRSNGRVVDIGLRYAFGS